MPQYGDNYCSKKFDRNCASPYLCRPKFQGSLAQLVQSICLTSRGSAVRTRHPPQTKNRTRRWPVLIFDGLSRLAWKRTAKIKTGLCEAEDGFWFAESPQTARRSQPVIPHKPLTGPYVILTHQEGAFIQGTH